MKKLYVCLALALAIAMIIAHFRGGVAALGADELAARSADAAMNLLAEYNVPITGAESSVRAVLVYFLEPGSYAASRSGVDPSGRNGLILSAFIGWWLWLSLARLVWTGIARIFGLADMAHMWVWLLFVPPWRPIWRTWLYIKRWYKHFFVHKGPSAAWTGFLATLTLVYRRADFVFLGRPLWGGIPLFQQIGIRGKLHLLVVAASGAGKTRWLTAWLGRIRKKGAALVVDCDAQIVNAIGEPLERAGHRVLNLDPFGLSRFPKACWNALDELDRAVKRHGRKAAVRFAQTLAEALVPETNSHQPIFGDVSRVFAHGVILWIWLFAPKEKRNLVYFRELVTSGMPELVLDPKQDPFAVLLHTMRRAGEYDDRCGGEITAVITRAAHLMESGQRAKEGNPFRTSLIAATAWLDFPEMAAISKSSDFACEDLKLTNTCLFISAPVVDVQTKLSGWVRVLTATTWYAFANIPLHLKIPCIFALDEAFSLRIPSLDTASPVARKHGIRLVLITQDVEKMKQGFPQSYKGFIGNAMATVWMGTDHPDNLEMLSEILGTCRRKVKIEGGWFSKTPARYQLVEDKLAHPHQLRDLLDPDRGWMIVTRFGKPPMLLAIETPETALPVWALNPDPAFGEKILRALGRLVWKMLRPHGKSARRP